MSRVYTKDVLWSELSWLDHYKTLHYRVALGTIEGLFSEKERTSAHVLYKFHHCLELGRERGFIESFMGQRAVEDCYKNIFVKSKGIKDRVAVKSNEAEEYLKDLNIPSINILSFGATSKNIDDTSIPACDLHSEKCDNPKCSLANVKYMKKFVGNLIKTV